LSTVYSRQSVNFVALLFFYLMLLSKTFMSQAT